MPTHLEMIKAVIDKYGESKGYQLLGISQRSYFNYKNGKNVNKSNQRKIEETFRKLAESDENEKSGSNEPDITNKYIALLEEKSNLTEKIQTLESRCAQLQEKVEQSLLNQGQMTSFLKLIAEHVGLKKAGKLDTKKTRKSQDNTH